MQSTSMLARSCAACRRRKIRCDRAQPTCAYCRKHALECEWPPAQKRARHDDRSSPAPATTQHADWTSSNQPFWAQVNAEAGPAEVLGNSQGQNDANKIDPQPIPELLLFQTSPFPGMGMKQCHPPPTDALRLWQAFVDNVDPLIKIIHTPTIQSKLLQASLNPDAVEPSFEALMFAIYYAALISTRVGQAAEQNQVNPLGTYRWALNQALCRAGFFQRSRNIVSLQAFVMYLVCARLDSDSPCVWTLVSLAIRVGMRLGLHAEKTDDAHSPYDREMRRRLWWQICVLDVRTAEDEAIAPFLQPAFLQVPLPGNVSDADLHAEMTHTPKANSSGIALFYNNARIEVTQGLRATLFDGKSGLSAEETENAFLQTRLTAIDSLENRLQSAYFDHCDASIPLCSFTITTVRLVLSKARLTLHVGRDSPAGEWCSEVDDFLFDTSVDLLERTHALATSRQYEQWWWLFRTYVEWDAMALVLRSLCRRPDRDDADRAWKAIDVASKYAETLAAGSSYRQRWSSLCRLKSKAHAARGESNLPEQARPSNPTDLTHRLQHQQADDANASMLSPNTMCLDELEPYGSMTAYWNLLDDDWSTTYDGSLAARHSLS